MPTQHSSLFLRTSLTMCFHLGKSLLNLWTPLTQSFRGSEILGAISSNHCCPIGQASKRHCKLLPMCGVCVFNTSQSINMKTGYSPFIWKDNFSKISWPGMDSRPPRFAYHPHPVWPTPAAFSSLCSQKLGHPPWPLRTLTLCRPLRWRVT